MFLRTSSVYLLLFLTTSLYPIDKDTTHERGIHFKGLDSNITSPSTLKSEKKLLAELVKIAKMQLNVQKEILKEIKQIRNPQPEKIVVNGVECLANTTPECFQMPITIRGKQYPVYKEWLRNPNEKNTLAMVQWESKFQKQVSDASRMRDYVITKYGDKALKTSFNRSTYNGRGGEFKVIREKNKKYILNNYASKKIDLVLYFGKNAELDYQSFYNYQKNIKALQKIKYEIVFYTIGAKKAISDSAKVFKELQYLLTHASKITVNQKRFSTDYIYATPTIAMKLKDTGEIMPVTVGNLFSAGMQSRMVKMLEMKNIIKSNHSTDYKMFDRVGEVGSVYIKHYYNKELNMDLIKRLYNEDKK